MRELVGDLSVQIRAALGAFSSESQQQGRRLRDLLDSSPTAFLEVVRGMLLEARETPELRYVVALLSARGLLLALLRDLARTDRGAAGAVAQMAQRMDPGFDKALARSVLDEHGRAEVDPEFLLGLVEALTGGFNLLPLLGKLRHSENPRVRSKLARMLGKAARAHEWFNTLRVDPDPRVRANAIESLWAAESPYSAACFESALEDTHHRVVANGLIGLYLQGDVESIAKLAEMAGHQEGAFRAAAAWAMGRTGDPRFVPLLRNLRKDGSNPPGVIRNALQSITRIRQGLAAVERRQLRLRVLEAGMAQRVDGAEWEQAVVLARDEDGRGLPEVKGTDWVLEAGEQPVWQYAVERQEAPPRVAVGILLPATAQGGAAEMGRAGQWQRILEELLAQMRRNDSAAVQFYSEEPHPQYLERTGDILKIGLDEHTAGPMDWDGGRLLADSGRLRTVLAGVPEARNLREGPADPLAALAETLKVAHGARHILLVLDQPKRAVWSEARLGKAAEALRKHGVVLHGFATRNTPAEAKAGFNKLCRESGGALLESATVEEAAADAADVVASLYRSYRLTFPGDGRGQRRVEVQGPEHQGRAEWRGKEDAAAA